MNRFENFGKNGNMLDHRSHSPLDEEEYKIHGHKKYLCLSVQRERKCLDQWNDVERVVFRRR